jgi:hypothetical protein
MAGCVVAAWLRFFDRALLIVSGHAAPPTPDRADLAHLAYLA